MGTGAQPGSDLKWRFLEEVFLSNAIGDAFSVRAGGGIYAPGTDDDQRWKLRDAVKGLLRRLASKYSTVVGEEEHIQNIAEFSNELSSSCGHLLAQGRFRFGIAQKALNVYLKYLWCAERIPVPPHCPFDSIVINKLKLPVDCPYQWTKVDDASVYRRWVHAAKAVAGNQSLSDWELSIWQGY